MGPQVKIEADNYFIFAHIHFGAAKAGNQGADFRGLELRVVMPDIAKHFAEFLLQVCHITEIGPGFHKQGIGIRIIDNPE